MNHLARYQNDLNPPHGSALDQRDRTYWGPPSVTPGGAAELGVADHPLGAAVNDYPCGGPQVVYRLYLGIADGMSSARVWTRRDSK